MTDIVYKVTCPGPEGLPTSCSMANKAMVTYKRGEFVEAPRWLSKEGYHLLVFDNLEHAEDFWGEAIWKAEAEEEILLLPKRHSISLTDAGELIGDTGSWPTGTRMYKRVKLLEKIR